MSESPPLSEPVKRAGSGLVRNSLINSGFTLISRFTGAGRDVVLAAWLGASGNPLADAYNTAQQFPNLFRRIFAEGAFSAAFLPSYTSVMQKDGKAAADKLAHDAMATLAFLTIILTVAFELAMPWVMLIFRHGFVSDPEKFKMAVLFTQITMPYLPCMAIVAHLSGVLNANGRFMVSAAVQIFLNLITLAFVLPTHNPHDAALWGSIGTIVAGIVQAGFLMWGVSRTGAHISLSVIPVWTKEIRGILALAVPGALAATATQINVLVSGMFSSTIKGAASWLSYADRFYQLPLGLVGVAIGTALLPALSRAVHSGDHEQAQTTMDRAVVFAMALSLPAAVALMAMPFYLVDALYTRGQFFTYDAQQTALLLFHYGWGVPAFVMTRILNPAFFARKDTMGPMKFALISVAVNLACAFGLFPIMGAPGLAVGTSAAAWVNVILMVVTLSRRGTWTIGKSALGKLILLMLASAGMAVFCATASTYRTELETLMGPYIPKLHALKSSLSHPVKEIAVVVTGLTGVACYGLLLLITGAVKPSDLKALKRK